MEMHLVHESADLKSYAVIAIFFDVGFTKNKFLGQVSSSCHRFVPFSNKSRQFLLSTELVQQQGGICHSWSWYCFRVNRGTNLISQVLSRLEDIMTDIVIFCCALVFWRPGIIHTARLDKECDSGATGGGRELCPLQGLPHNPTLLRNCHLDSHSRRAYSLLSVSSLMAS